MSSDKDNTRAAHRIAGQLHDVRQVADRLQRGLAALGLRSLDEAVGRVDLLDTVPAVSHWKAAGLDLAPLLCEHPALSSPQHLRAEETQHGRQQGQRRHHGQADHERDRHRHPVQGADLEREQPQQRDGHGRGPAPQTAVRIRFRA